MSNSGLPTGPAPGQGLNEYCQQMKAMGAAGGQQNESAGAVCYRSYTTCASTCDGVAAGYTGQIAESMRATAQGCRRFQSTVVALGNQGLSAQTSGSGGDICNNVSQAAPQSMGGPGGAQNAANSAMPASGSGNPNDPYGCGSDPNSAACQQCSSNPNTPACRALAYEKETRGEAAFNADTQSQDKPKGSGFDIQEPATDASGFSVDPNAAAGAAVKNGTIANNAGGGIPGGGGGSPASLGGGAGGGKGSPGSPGYTTDVLQGLSSPSGYSQSAEPNEGGEGGFQGYGTNGRAPATDQNGVDLRRFLPGGDKDPMRRGVGGIDINSAQINGRFVNIWNRISDRMQEKCRLGELIGCGR